MDRLPRTAAAPASHVAGYVNDGMSQRHTVNEEKTHLQGQASLAQPSSPPHHGMSVHPQRCLDTLSVPAGCSKVYTRGIAGCSKRFKTEYDILYT